MTTLVIGHYNIVKVADTVRTNLAIDLGVGDILKIDHVVSYVKARVRCHVQNAQPTTDEYRAATEIVSEIFADMDGCPRWLYDQIVKFNLIRDTLLS